MVERRIYIKWISSFWTNCGESSSVYSESFLHLIHQVCFVLEWWHDLIIILFHIAHLLGLWHKVWTIILLLIIPAIMFKSEFVLECSRDPKSFHGLLVLLISFKHVNDSLHLWILVLILLWWSLIIILLLWLLLWLRVW